MNSASCVCDGPQQPRLLRVCRIGRAQGLKGEVNVYSYTDDPEDRYAVGSRLVVRAKDGSAGREFTVVSARRFRQRWILRFSGVTNRTSAEALLGIELFYEPDLKDDNEDDGIYLEGLIGLSAQLEDGTPLGKVTDAINSPGQTLLELTEPHGSVSLVPYVKEIVPDIDLKAGVVVLNPPVGLLQEL
ncbi:MAG: ribosome maturation factor RimM [Aeriscardovia sp.]|nr:ribosome maturation factor RimM [Aeriscardovia sp.]